MSKTTLDWTPLPGHYPGQRHEDRFYGNAMYRGMYVEIFERYTFEGESTFDWSFYDDDSGDPELAVATNDEHMESVSAAEDDVTDYIDSYIYEKENAKN